MGKHLGLKAYFLLVVIFFHSFVLVPKSYSMAGASKGALRLVWNAAAPTAIQAAVAAEKVALVGWKISGVVGLAYVLYEAGALDKLLAWYDSFMAYPEPDGTETSGQTFSLSSNWWGTVTATAEWNGSSYRGKAVGAFGSNGSGSSLGNVYTAYGHSTSIAAKNAAFDQWKVVGDSSGWNGHTWLHWGTGSPNYPSVPVDISNPVGDIDFGLTDLWGTQGAGAMLSGAPVPEIVSVSFLEPGDVAGIKEAMGLTAIDPDTGAQPESAPNDNTITQGDKLSQGLLQSILGVLIGIKDYAFNLVGIKADTGNIVTSVQNMSGKMDNVAIGINAQTEIAEQQLGKLDNVAQSVESLKETSANESTLSSRLSNIKSLLLTKFPFSIVAAVTSPGSVTGGTYSIPDLQFPMGQVVSVDPMENAEIAAWVAWLRGLMAVGMWAIFILVMVRRATQI